MKKLRTLGNLGRLAIGISLVASLFACSAVLGLTDPTLDNSITGDSGSGSDVISTTDGPIVTKNDSGIIDAGPMCDAAGIATDPNNCGSCGHSCLGGACKASACQPVVVDTDIDNTSPYDLSIDDGVIFFTNSSSPNYSVRSIDKTFINKGIGDSDLIVSSTPQPYGIATTGANVFFAAYGANDNQGKIEKCATGNCATPANISNLDSFTVATDGTNVVYGDKFTPTDGGDAIYTVKKTNLNLTPSTSLTPVEAEVYWLKIAGGIVYIGLPALTSPGGLFSCPLTGCSNNPTQLSFQDVEELYVVSDTVFFTSSNGEAADKNGQVRSVGINGAGETVLADGIAVPLGIVADSTYVYFGDQGDIDDGDPGHLYRCPISGCGVKNVLAVDYGQGGNPQGLVDDGNAIYWGDYNGKIYKLAK